MKILINDYEDTKDQYTKIFGNFGYEHNQLIFLNSFESTKDFIVTYLEKKKLHIDLIITNDSKDNGKDILKANQLSFFKNNLITSYSKENFRINSIPIILYSENETKSEKFLSSFSSIINKNEFGEHDYFIHECEKAIKNWRKLLQEDLDALEIKPEQLPQFINSEFFNKYYFRKISNNAEHYFVNKTKIVSMEFIKAPTNLNYDWIVFHNNQIEEAILKYTDTYRNHVKYDRKNGERAILHEFFRQNRTILLRDIYNDLEYELNLKELKVKNSEECDFILKTEYPDFLATTFFEVKKEDVTFYVKKNTKRPQISSEFLSHLQQVWGYKEYTENPKHELELNTKLGYSTKKFDFVLLAGRLEEKEEMKNIFNSQINRMFEGIKVITYEELEEVNTNYLDKFNRLKI
jgi:hypothetical protein